MISDTFWKNGPVGSIASDDPDLVIPKLLAMDRMHNGKVVPREILTLLVVYNLKLCAT